MDAIQATSEIAQQSSFSLHDATPDSDALDLQAFERALFIWHGQCSRDSLLRRHLTSVMFRELCGVRSAHGSTLGQCIASGLNHPESKVGIYAADADAYRVFAPLFDGIIRDCHPRYGTMSVCKEVNRESPTYPDDVRIREKVLTSRVRCARNLAGYAFPPAMSEKEFQDIESIALSLFETFDGELEGTYYSFSNMSDEERAELALSGLSFSNEDKYLRAAGAYRHWPEGRGVFMNSSRTFIVWVNEEDHLRVISLSKGDHFDKTYRIMRKALDLIERRFACAWSPNLGFLTSCPSNLGTGLRASVHVRLPNLGSNRQLMKREAAALKLAIRGSGGEHTSVVDNVFDISNSERLGMTEADLVHTTWNGMLKLLKLDDSLSALNRHTGIEIEVLR